MGMREDLENDIYITVGPKDSTLDHRTTMCGGAAYMDGENKKFDIPAHSKWTAEQLGYRQYGGEFSLKDKKNKEKSAIVPRGTDENTSVDEAENPAPRKRNLL